MPSTATITSFYSFVANTKARATQVNSNFSLYRGHIIPIEPNTQTASNQTYDLGSSEYRWRSLYTNNINMKSNTASSAIVSFSPGTTSAGDFGVYYGGSKKHHIGYERITFDLQTTSSNTFEILSGGHTCSSLNLNREIKNINTITGYYDFLMSGNTIASLKANGIYTSNNFAFNSANTATQYDFILGGATISSMSYTEGVKASSFKRTIPRQLDNTATGGDIAIQQLSSSGVLNATTAATPISGTTMTISVTGNYPTEISVSARALQLNDTANLNKSIYAQIFLYEQVTGVYQPLGSNIAESYFYYPVALTTTSITITHPMSYTFITAYAPNTLIFSLRYSLTVNGGVTTSANIVLSGVQMHAKEIYT